MDVIFDMETGDPDDLITLLMLINNPDVNLKAVTCYQGSPIQIGLINHVLNLAGLNNSILVGGLNSIEPMELSPYYTETVGMWKPAHATMSPVEVFENTFAAYPDIHVLTGAPLTNLGLVLDQLPNLRIKNMTTQGGYIGDLVEPSKKLKKFLNKPNQRTYNLGNDVEAFTKVNFSDNIDKLTFVTKDLCHGFVYTAEIHKNINFANNPIANLLQKCLEKYALAGKNKAMHDPLAMLIMLYPELGITAQVNMNYHINDKSHPVFSSQLGEGFTNALTDYKKDNTWNKFISICQDNTLNNNLHKTKNKLK